MSICGSKVYIFFENDQSFHQVRPSGKLRAWPLEWQVDCRCGHHCRAWRGRGFSNQLRPHPAFLPTFDYPGLTRSQDGDGCPHFELQKCSSETYGWRHGHYVHVFYSLWVRPLFLGWDRVGPFEAAVWTFNPLGTIKFHYMEKNPAMFSSKTLLSLRLKKERHERDDMGVSKWSGNVYSGS